MGERVQEADHILESNRLLFLGTPTAVLAKRRNGFEDQETLTKGHSFGCDFNSCIHWAQERNEFLSIGINKYKGAEKIQANGVMHVRPDESKKVSWNKKYFLVLERGRGKKWTLIEFLHLYVRLWTRHTYFLVCSCVLRSGEFLPTCSAMIFSSAVLNLHSTPSIKPSVLVVVVF